MFLLTIGLACTKPAESGAPGDLVLATGFGTETVSGTASGDVEGETTCTGWFPATPQHTMTLEDVFTDLSLEVDQAGLVIRATYESSTFCSDEVSGLPSIVRGSWSAGDYEIFVGTTSEGETFDYVLTVVESGS